MADKQYIDQRGQISLFGGNEDMVAELGGGHIGQ